jgi:hypothetical protein
VLFRFTLILGPGQLPEQVGDGLPQTRAAVRQCIEIELDKLPPVYAPDVYQRKCDLTYQHVYDAYFGEGRSIYAGAA